MTPGHHWRATGAQSATATAPFRAPAVPVVFPRLPETADNEWHRWTPRAAVEAPWLPAAVTDFDGTDSAGGAAAANWLKRDALANHGSTITWLLVRERRVLAFFASCNTSVELSVRHRAEVGVTRRTQPATLLAWIGRDRSAPSGTGYSVFEFALGLARDGARVQGSVALVADPHDADAEAFWLQPKYGFRRSQTEIGPAEYRRFRLWRRLFGPDESF